MLIVKKAASASNYVLLVGDEDLANLISNIQSATIRTGNELERLILQKARVLLNRKVLLNRLNLKGQSRKTLDSAVNNLVDSDLTKQGIIDQCRKILGNGEGQKQLPRIEKCLENTEEAFERYRAYNLDEFFVGTLPDGPYLIPKKVITNDHRLTFGTTEPDFILFVQKTNTCTIIEMKLGINFDTKKSQSEKDTLTNYKDHFRTSVTRAGTGYVVTFAIACWEAETRDQIVRGLKGKFNKSETMTGREFCKAAGISFADIDTQLRQNQKQNRRMIFDEIESIRKKLGE
jgi:hypothetical protein